MSATPTNQPSFVPQPSHYPPAPEIIFDRSGNPFTRNHDGQWFPYSGPFPQNIAPPPPLSQVPAGHHSSVPHDNMRDGPNQPVSQAFQTSYQLGASTLGTAGGITAIDPVLISLPDTKDDDLSDGPTIAKAQGHTASIKIAGARRVDKGKQRADTSRKRKHDSDNEEDEGRTIKKGRPSGSGNYLSEDVTALLDFTERELPLGQRGWKAVHRKFSKWAQSRERPARTMKSLETKFKQLVKIKKPTGTAACPPEIKRAHKIDEKINERACTRDLSDSEFDGDGKGSTDNPSSDEEVEIIEKPSKVPTRTVVARRLDDTTTQPRRNVRGGNGMELVSKLTQALDPNIQHAHDDGRAARSIQNTQLITMSQQLRNAQSTIESLRSQLTVLQSRMHDADRARDRAELKMEMMELASGKTSRSKARHRAWPKRREGVERVRGKIRCEDRYPEGGGYTYWVTDNDSSDSSGFDDKENQDPQCSTSRGYHQRSRGHSRTRESTDRCGILSSLLTPPLPIFHSAIRGLNNTVTSPSTAPGLNVAGSDLEYTPPRPSSMSIGTNPPSSNMDSDVNKADFTTITVEDNKDSDLSE